MKAVKEGQLPRVRYLINRGADVDHGESLDTLLVKAVRYGRVEIAETLILVGADVNRKEPYGDQAIYVAARETTDESLAILKLLLWAGCELDMKGAKGDTPLHRAVSGRIANVLIQGGADIESRWSDTSSILCNRDGFTPLHEHACEGRIEVGEILIQAGADVNARCGEGKTPLGRCLSLKRTEDRESIIALLRAHGARE
jgi:ankyrin repeat protein